MKNKQISILVLSFISNRDLSSNRLRAIKKGTLQGLQDIDNL